MTVLIPRHSKTRKDAFIGMAMGLFLDLASEILCANRSSIMAVERTSRELRIVRSRGFHGNALQSSTVRLGEGISGSVASRGMPLFVQDIEAEPSFGRRNLPRYTTPSFMSLPVQVRGLPFPVINLANRQDGKAFTVTDMRIAAALCERVSRCFEDLCSSGDGEHDSSQGCSSLW